MANDPRFTAYRRAHGLSAAAARAKLIHDGLAQWQAQQAGGAARARVLSPERRRDLARAAARARWGPSRSG